MSGILFIFHCSSNTGYAIQSLERSFFEAAVSVAGLSRTFFAYPDISRGKSDSIPKNFNNIIQFDHLTEDPDELDKLKCIIKENGISVIFGFDQPVHRAYYGPARRAGVKKIISYWGAPISSIHSGIKLYLKRLDVARRLNAPNLYLFESDAMSKSATHGRGIPKAKVKTIYLGVDTDKFKPDAASNYAYEAFNIAREKKIIFYSGHMEPRKGVAVIMKAANILLDEKKRNDLHFLLLGNQPGEERPYVNLLTTKAKENVTFGGYRNDIHMILPSCYAGCIASTGWDSFTMSSLEMASCGLPLLVSELQGLVETVEHGKTGYHFKTGEPDDLSDKLSTVLDKQSLKDAMSRAARLRITKHFSKETQVSAFSDIIDHALET